MPTPASGSRFPVRRVTILTAVLLSLLFLGCMSLEIGTRKIEATSTGDRSSVGVIEDPSGVLWQEGKVTLAGWETTTVYYPVPFASIPNLEVTPPANIRGFKIVEQKKCSFRVKNDDPFTTASFTWSARGVKDGNIAPAPLPPQPIPIETKNKLPAPGHGGPP